MSTPVVVPPEEPETEVPEVPATLPEVEEILDIAPSPLVSPPDDPVHEALRIEKRRNKRLKRLLTENQNRSTVVPEVPVVPSDIDPPVEPVERQAQLNRGDPIERVARILGGRKKHEPGDGSG